MSSKAAVWQYFAGGLADDDKIGVKGSSGYLQAFDVRAKPSQMSVLPRAVLEDNNIVSDLILGEVMTADGTIYACGDAGNVYRRATSGAWSMIGRLSSGCGGIDYRRDTDSVYLTSNKTVSQIANISTAPVLNPDIYAASFSQYVDPTGTVPPTYQAGSILTSAVPTTRIEAPTDTRFFQTDIEPVSKISLFIVSKGTGDWTLYLEDGNDAVLAQATVTNANLKNGQFNDFVFSSAPNGQVRLYPAPNARTYHIHIISTVADGTVASSSTNDMNSCDLEVWADRLVYPSNGLHPMERFLQYEIIGNGNYISVWEPITAPPTNAEWLREGLTVPMEYECCGAAHTNEFLVAAFEKVSTSATMSPQEGLLIFWDGTATTYNYDVPITEGAPYGLHVYQNVVYYYAGGALWAITSPTTQPIKLKIMPGSITDFYGANTPIKLYPQAMTTRRGIQLIGYPGMTTNTSVNFGVYGWGATNKNHPQSLTYNYIGSTQSKNYSNSNNLRIGMVKSFDDLLHISWRDDLNGSYGIDKVDNSSPAAPTSIWRSLIVDNGFAAKYKGGMYVEVYFVPLPAGATLQLAYSINRGNWISDPNIYTSTNFFQGLSDYARFDVSLSGDGVTEAGRFREIQAQVTITCTTAVATAPIVVTPAIIFDDKREERL